MNRFSFFLIVIVLGLSSFTLASDWTRPITTENTTYINNSYFNVTQINNITTFITNNLTNNITNNLTNNITNNIINNYTANLTDYAKYNFTNNSFLGNGSFTTSNNITANSYFGNLFGGTASNSDLTIKASTHPAPGRIYLGGDNTTNSVNILTNGILRADNVGIGVDADTINYGFYMKKPTNAIMALESGTGYSLMYYRRNGTAIGYEGLGSTVSNDISFATYAGTNGGMAIVTNGSTRQYVSADGRFSFGNPYAGYVGTAQRVKIVDMGQSSYPIWIQRENGFAHTAFGTTATNNSFIYLYNATQTVKTVISSEGNSYFLGGNLGAGVSPTQRMDIGYGNLAFTPVTYASNLSANLGGIAGAVNNGTHKYSVTYTTTIGETFLGTVSNTITVVDNATDGQVNLTSIPTGTAGQGVTGRKIYRTKAGGTTYFLLTTIADITTTTYTDNTADASLGADDASARDATTQGWIYSNSQKSGFIGKSNTALGYLALDHFTTGSNNVAIGASALTAVTTGVQNFGLGSSALGALTTGSSNTAIGTYTLSNSVGDSQNIAIGRQALIALNGGTSNMALGYNTGISMTTGSYNTLLGFQAGYDSLGATGNAITTGGNNVFIGYKAGLANGTQRSNSVAIGKNAVVNGDYIFALGGTGADAVKVGINTSLPVYPFEVQSAISGISIYTLGNVSATGYNTRTSIYDTSKGLALDKIKDANSYKKADGKINHNAFYGYAGTVTTTDYSRPITKKVTVVDHSRPLVESIIVGNTTTWDEVNNQTIIEYEYKNKVTFPYTIESTNIEYPFNKTEEQVSITDEIDLLRQAVYELKVKDKNKDDLIANLTVEVEKLKKIKP